MKLLVILGKTRTYLDFTQSDILYVELYMEKTAYSVDCLGGGRRYHLSPHCGGPDGLSSFLALFHFDRSWWCPHESKPGDEMGRNAYEVFVFHTALI